MPLIFITGISTSGKSTVAKELSLRGYEAYDTEHSGISAWYDKVTGERVAEFGKVPERTKAWTDQHHWLISLEWVATKAKEAQTKTIFLCGGGANESEVHKLCQKVFWLQTNKATIRARVNNPRDHTYGTKPHELEDIIASNERKEAEYIQLGATIIDAKQPIAKVVDDIISKLEFS